MTDDNTLFPGDDAPRDAPAPGDVPVSPPDPVPSEDEGADAQGGMIDVIVRGPVLGARMGAVISVTPTVFEDYKPFLSRID